MMHIGSKTQVVTKLAGLYGNWFFPPNSYTLDIKWFRGSLFGMNRQSYSVGILILIAGFVILLGKLGVFDVLGAMFWPLFILVPGILLHVLVFGRVIPAVALIPAGILTVVSILLLIGNWFGWKPMKYLWPFFLLAVAVGLYEYHLFGNVRSRYLWLASVLLACLSLLLFGVTLLWTWGAYVLAAALIALGSWLVVRKPRLW